MSTGPDAEAETYAVEVTMNEAYFLAVAALPTFAAFLNRLAVAACAALALVGAAMSYYSIGAGAVLLAVGLLYPPLVFAADMIVRRLRVRRVRRDFGGEAAGRGVQRVTLSPAGVATADTAGGECFTRWFSVRILRSPQGLFLFLSNIVLVLCFVPDSAFADGAARERFETAARRFHVRAGASGDAPAVRPPLAAAGADALSYTLTLEDQAAFQRFLRRRTRTRRVFIGLTGPALAISGVGILMNSKRLTGLAAEESIAAIGLCMLFLSLFGLRSLGGDRRLARGNPDDARTRGPLQVEVAPNGFHVTNRIGRQFVFWRSIIAVETGTDGLYLFTAPKRALIIPRGAFDSDDTFAAFVGAIRERLAK